ncbi:lactate utilization protein [Hathewaya limosa]|uniref:L-lactate utilization protein LutB n=1 Tax=Hathewaya limosa TaxID=1536 RepID=A0ABU0JTG0_HATLI|nr:lactate utilization protein [Hathewaya limosa]AWZ47414.1 lactate utilization protein [Clostridiaceae bacterium 14S0207]MDQ0480375.1 L-lactate utilization protein LutB [Hathewaya limosa]
MDKNLQWLNEQKILRTIDSLKKNNMNGYLVKDKEELIAKIEELVEEGSVVACGGSMTLQEIGVMEHLKSGRYEFLDRTGLSGDEVKKVYRATFSADAFFSSSNAITENGELYNVDGNGNRVSAMLFGPDKVIIVAGVNKIVKNVEEAVNRNRYIAAPTNSKRLNIDTPCSKLGYCVECNSPKRICKEYTLIKGQIDENRIHVIFLNEEIGY